MKPADISCVIPTLNCAWCIGETLQSIAGQAESSARILVVDSDSTDDTLNICARFGVEVVTEPRGNLYRAINAGLRRCDTEWVAYTNADDPWYNDAHRRLLDVAREQRADLVYGSFDCIDHHGRFLYSFTPPPPDQLIALFRSGWMPFAQQTVIFRRELFERLGGFDTQFNLSADFDFFLRAYVQGARFVRLGGRPVSRWRLHSGQLSHQYAESAESQKQQIAARAGLRATAADRLRILAWRAANWHNYVERMVRAKQLRGGLSLPRALQS